ncbi:MAG: glycosyl hydrolase-related protein, partial [Armatimonadetes bacterium]|nr:glycosyl hydrolase-related protein [Armatimonadota bacterium]
KIYLQPSSHVDIGYTDFQERVVQRHNENMSLALDLCRQYPDFKWNTEAAWVEDNYLSIMPEDKKAEFIKLANEGRIGCQAIYGNMLTGICSQESFIRDLYFARDMAKKYGIPYDIAMSSDVPTQVWTLPTVLAGAGIKYFSDGLNLTRGDSFNRLFGKSPFYWQGPDGAKVLTWLSPGYAYAANLGLLGTVDGAKNRVEGFLRGYDRADYPYDAVLAFGGIGDNQPLNPVMAQVVDDWNKKYAYPKIIPCRGPEFFQYVEAGFRDKIPTISGDGGVYWEDGAGSSAHETSLVRRAKEDLAGAEKLWSLMSASRGAAYPKAEFDQAWKNAILYDEHTWGAHCSVSEPANEQTVHQWKIKAQFAYDAAKQADQLLKGALDELAKSVKCEADSVVAFNPLSFTYTGPVTAKDKQGRSVLVWAKDVPPMGCKVVPIVKFDPTGDLGKGLGANVKAGEQPVTMAADGTPVLQNRFYRLEFDKLTGAVKSLYDKELNLELVDPKAGHGINEYIYVAGQGANAKEVTRDATTPPATMSGSIGYIAEGKSARPYQYVMEIKGSAYKTPQVVSRVILYEDTKRIDFENVLTKEETFDKEAGYFAFPFALRNPEFYVELPDGVVRPKKEMLPGACMQWYCLQDFAAAADESCAVIWTAVDSPLMTIGDLNRDTFKSPLPIENGHMYGYVFNNYWFTNYKASQGGEMVFRFALTSMKKYDPTAASRFGQSARISLPAAVCEASSGAVGPAPGSFCSASPSNVVIQAVKRAESGTGVVIRLREVAGVKTVAQLKLGPRGFKEAWSCNLVEEPQSKLRISSGKVSVPLPANGLATVLLK